MERWTLAIGLWCCAAAALYLCRKRSPFSPLVIALAATGIIGSFFPVMTMFIQPASWRNLGAISEASIVAAQIQYLAFAAGMLVSVLLADHAGWLAELPATEVPHPRSRIGQRDLFIASGLVLVGAPLYFAYVMHVGIDVLTNREDFGQKYLAGAGLGPLAFGLPVAMAGCLWAEAGGVSNRVRWCFRGVGLAVIVWSLGFISVRTNFAVILLGTSAILCARRGVRVERIRPVLIVLLLCAYALLEGFSFFRGAYKGDLMDALSQMQDRGSTTVAAVVGGSELAHPFITAAEVIETEEEAGFAGQTLVDAVLAFVPTSLVPDRPPAPSEWFARRHYSAFAKGGGGTGFSLVIEGWLDFGSILGPFAFGSAIALLLGWIERRRARTPHSMLMRIEPYFLLLVVIGHRSDVASIVKQVVSMCVVATVVWIGAELALVHFMPRVRTRSLAAEGNS
ncbi:MAG TPA: hypothetical protein VK843_13100 [Planctomycetota bacterium]|nr:hypothetical protein [Planctomycetota bacterium]